MAEVVIHVVEVDWRTGWEEAAQWLTDRLGDKFTDAGRSRIGPDTPGYITEHQDIIDSDKGWDVCFKPPDTFLFMIKDRDTAMLFKLTFGGR